MKKGPALAHDIHRALETLQWSGLPHPVPLGKRHCMTADGSNGRLVYGLRHIVVVNILLHEGLLLPSTSRQSLMVDRIGDKLGSGN